MVGMLVAALDNPIDLLMLLVVALLIFGKNLPDVARSLGKGIRDLKETVNFDEMNDALHTVNQVRTAVSPASIARAAIPGVAELQDTVGATKDMMNPLAAPTTAGEDETAAVAEAAPAPAQPAAPEPALAVAPGSAETSPVAPAEASPVAPAEAPPAATE
jgi:TatA/E family protein of Tat protein translocase